MLSLILVALAAIAEANPVPAATSSPVLCPAVTKLLTALKQQKPASAFCSSYLRIPIVTTTSTRTEASVATVASVLSNTVTVTAEITTQTIFETPTTTENIVTTSTVTSISAPTTTVTSALTCTPPAVSVFSKRAATVAKPAGLAAFTVSAAILSACKCLSVPTSTTTATTKSITISTTTVTEGSIVTVTFTPTTTTTETGVPTTTTIVTATQFETVNVPNPTPTATAYALPDQAPFKIQTSGDAGAGLYLSSAPFDNPYTFGGSGNVFHYVPDVGFGPFGLKDDTLGLPTVYDANGPVLPLRRGSGFSLVCSIHSAPGGGQQQTCPFACRKSDVAPPGNWNCDGFWFSRDIGGCSTFQAYAISQ